jgi:hypothetical protein
MLRKSPDMEAVLEAMLDALRPSLRELVRQEVWAAVEERYPPWLTVAQAAERIGIGSSAVRERIRKGVLPGQEWEGRWYVRATDIDVAIQSGSAATVTTHHTYGPSAVAPAPALTTRRNP